MEAVAIKVRTPFPWSRLLQYLSHRMVPGAECIEGTTYVRTWSGHEIVVHYDAASEQLEVRCAEVIREFAVQRIRFLFQTDHEATHIDEHLCQSPPLNAVVRACPGLRPLGTWSAFEL